MASRPPFLLSAFFPTRAKEELLHATNSVREQNFPLKNCSRYLGNLYCRQGIGQIIFENKAAVIKQTSHVRTRIAELRNCTILKPSISCQLFMYDEFIGQFNSRTQTSETSLYLITISPQFWPAIKGYFSLRIN